MTLLSPFPAAHARELHRWLNAPRDPNFAQGQASDIETVTTMLAEKTAAGFTFAAIVDGAPIGFIGFAPLSADEGQFAGMVIAPEHRGMGWGTRFLILVTAQLRERGFKRMSAVVRSGNRAIQSTFAGAGAVPDMQVWSFIGQGGKGKA